MTFYFMVSILENKSLPSARDNEISNDSPYLPSLTIITSIRKMDVDVIVISDTITIRAKNRLRYDSSNARRQVRKCSCK